MIIDAHAHIYPKKIALRATQSISTFYDIGMMHEGNVDLLLEVGNKGGIDKFLVHSVATTARQVDKINEFIAKEIHHYPDRLIGFATLHPESTRIAEEVDTAIKFGLKGIKLHPDFQKFNIDDNNAMQIYEAIEGRLPLVIHTGDHRTQFSKPQKLATVLDRFPNLDVIAAHFGGWSEWDDGVKYLAQRPNVYVDSSSTQYALSPEKVYQLIQAFGVEKVIFGSDFPMWNPKNELEMIQKLPLSQPEKENILHGNIERLLRKYEHENQL